MQRCMMQKVRLTYASLAGLRGRDLRLVFLVLWFLVFAWLRHMYAWRLNIQDLHTACEGEVTAMASILLPVSLASYVQRQKHPTGDALRRQCYRARLFLFLPVMVARRASA